MSGTFFGLFNGDFAGAWWGAQASPPPTPSTRSTGKVRKRGRAEPYMGFSIGESEEEKRIRAQNAAIILVLS